MTMPVLFALWAMSAAPPTGIDRSGDPLPSGALARLGSLRYRLGSGDSALGLTPDAKHVLVWRRGLIPDEKRRGVQIYGGTLGYLDLATGRLNDSPGLVQAEHVIAAPRADRIAVFREESLSMYALPSGKRLWAVEGKPTDNSPVFEWADKRKPADNGPVFDPTGRFVVYAMRGENSIGTVHVHHADTGERIESKVKLEKPDRIVGLSPDGSRLLVNRSEKAEMLECVELASGKRLWTVDEGCKEKATFRPDGREVAYASEQYVRIADAANGKIRRLSASEPVAKLYYSPDGKRLLAIGADTTLDLWDTATWKRLPMPPRPPHSSVLVAWPDGQLVLRFKLGSQIVRPNLDTGKATPTSGHFGAVSSLVFVNDRVVTAGWDGQVITWADNGREEVRVRLKEGWLSLSPCGRWVTRERAPRLESFPPATDGVVLRRSVPM